MPSLWTIAVLIVLPVLAVVLAYFNTLGADFVYDDNHQILLNPWVKELKYLPHLLANPVWAFKTTEPTNYYRPVQMGLYNVLWSLSGGKPFLFHLTNLLFHAMTACALAALVHRLSRSLFISGAAALLFAVHPINTEAVAWIACLPEITYSFFVLMTLLLHASCWVHDARHVITRKTFALLCAALAMFSKETGLTLIGLIFLLELWGKPRFLNSAEQSPVGQRTISGMSVSFLRAIRATLPYLLIAAGYLIARWSVVGGMAPRAREGLTWIDALINAPLLVFSYFRVIILPMNLLAHHIFEPLASFAHPGFVVALLTLGVMAGSVIMISRQRGDISLASALAFLPLLPVLYIPAIGVNAFAERYAYLPSAGIAWLFAAALAAGVQRFFKPKIARPALAALLLLVLIPFTVMSMKRNQVWQNDESLALATVREEPRATFMYLILGNWYDRHKEQEKALKTFERGFEADPGSCFLHAAVVTQQLKLHRITPEEAILEFQKLIERSPAFYDAWVNLGASFIKARLPEKAEAAYRRAIELNPNDMLAYDGLKLSLIAQGSTQVGRPLPQPSPESISSKANELRLEGIAHAKEGRLEHAEAAFLEALKLEPDSEKTLCMLGVVRAKRGDDQGAIDYCQKALAVKPDFAEAYMQIGVSAMRLGDLEKAIKALESAVSYAPKDKYAYEKLGLTYAIAGRTDDARRSWERALEIDPDFSSVEQHLKVLKKMK